MIRRIIRNIRSYRLKKHSPRMVNGYKRKIDGVFLPDTRISNSTFIDYPAGFDIDNNVFIGHYNFIEASNGIRIEKGCQITNFITITSHSSHNSIRLYGDSYGGGSKMVGYIKGPVHIGKFTFVGPHVTIMPNTNIGKGCLVSAYSYLSGNFPDFSIIAGNPAKVIGDTRTKDSVTLDNHPELKQMYNQWVNE